MTLRSCFKISSFLTYLLRSTLMSVCPLNSFAPSLSIMVRTPLVLLELRPSSSHLSPVLTYSRKLPVSPSSGTRYMSPTSGFSIASSSSRLWSTPLRATYVSCLTPFCSHRAEAPSPCTHHSVTTPSSSCTAAVNPGTHKSFGTPSFRLSRLSYGP